MGKQIDMSIRTRVLDAMDRAYNDGLKRENITWAVTNDSLSKMVCCPEYFDMNYQPFLGINPNLRGRICDVYVIIDPALKGNIAELRTSHNQYAITLDFADPPANTDRAQLRTWRQERG
jgi:hypothetical protein